LIYLKWCWLCTLFYLLWSLCRIGVLLI